MIEGAVTSIYDPTQTGVYTVIVTFPYGCSDSATLDVTELSVATVGGIRSSIHPNPVRDILHLEAADTAVPISIVDLTGKSVATFEAGSRDLDVSVLEPGIYLVRIGAVSAEFIKLQKVRLVKYAKNRFRIDLEAVLNLGNERF